jgi:transposase-like protein/IS1 family transposase
MLCQICQNEARKFGRNRNGSQRYRCDSCSRTWTDERTRPTDRRKLPAEKLVLCLRMLLEGNSIRSAERLTGVHRDTIIDAMVRAGKSCKLFLESAIHHIPVADVEADECWGFVGCKERTREFHGYDPAACGDAYVYTALERNTKLIVAWHLGKRSSEDTQEFADNLRRATRGRFQLTTDGYTPYQTAIPFTFGPRIDYATLVKDYETPDEGQRRYSPADIVGITIRIRSGEPDKKLICTSHVERHNRSIRMAVRRMTRLTDAHSKKWENHDAMLGLFFAFYNFCRVHSTLKETPAVAAGLTDHTWSVAELLCKSSAHS